MASLFCIRAFSARMVINLGRRMCWLLGIAVLFLSHNVVGAHYPRKSNDEPVTFVSLPHKLISDCDEDILEAWQEKISEDQVAQFLRVRMPDRVRTIARIEPLPVQKLRKLTGKYYDDFIDFYSCVGKDCFWLAHRMSMLKGQTLEFVVNNSTSMMRRDAKMLPGSREYMSRFSELRNRLCDIFRLLSYFPVETVSIRSFSSMSEPYEVCFQGKIPDEIFQMLTDHLAWIQPDYSGKPVGKCIKEVVKGRGERGAYVYVVTDGELEGYEQRDVERMLRLRNSEKFPVTFLTCTRQEDGIVWLKDLAGISNVRIAYDPSSEFRKIWDKQGSRFNYSNLFFLLSVLLRVQDSLFDKAGTNHIYSHKEMQDICGTTLLRYQYDQYRREALSLQVSWPAYYFYTFLWRIAGWLRW